MYEIQPFPYPLSVALRAAASASSLAIIVATLTCEEEDAVSRRVVDANLACARAWGSMMYSLIGYTADGGPRDAEFAEKCLTFSATLEERADARFEASIAAAERYVRENAMPAEVLPTGPF